MNIWNFLGLVSKANYNELEDKMEKAQAKIEGLEEIILEKNAILIDLITDKIDKSNDLKEKLLKNELNYFEKKQKAKFNALNQKIESLNDKIYSKINNLKKNNSNSLNKLSKKTDSINDLLKVIMANDLLADLEKVMIESQIKKLLLTDLKKIIKIKK
ncbi:hypothetical protein SAMN04515654_1395 [Halanaerobium congolense]|jgi:hypothetical protein|uniref:Uncharacterized protein n=1 Tax=Halanaerobium congolense TaxID=54121 RepID=A0A1G8SC51_9FIRM|nr:hypothetical protein [Halanaerobium congolense]PUU87911.1 MAG: hypothetical protein CI948_2465 [Halanaerobium sp.]TDS24354.1 hypothetical protein BY453_1711 [Halanaerobium congolense]SDJ26771.1 hypothetical protein SAMN04515654_1395 [Halanaerobium congolense]SET81535.1 hypothetical protein SAMN04515653_14014 [Halanaerobium congolense]